MKARIAAVTFLGLGNMPLKATEAVIQPFSFSFIDTLPEIQTKEALVAKRFLRPEILRFWTERVGSVRLRIFDAVPFSLDGVPVAKVPEHPPQTSPQRSGPGGTKSPREDKKTLDRRIALVALVDISGTCVS